MSPLQFRAFGLCAAALVAVGLAATGEGRGRPPSTASSPDAPTGLRLLARDGAHVTLAWQAAVSGAAAETYVIEGGLAPGEVLGSLPTGGVATVVAFDAPIGNFFVRVHAVANGQRSPASNEITLVVGDVAPLAPPPAPAGLLGLANGDTLALSWTDTLDGGPAAHLWLHVSGALSGVLPVPAGETFSVPGVPPGTYTFVLTAENASGESAPSNAVTLTFPGACAGPPQAPMNFRAWRSGDRLSIAWDPPTAGPAVSRYRVRVDGTYTLAFDTADRLVSAIAPDGLYVIRVDAVNACGGSAAAAGIDWAVAVRDGAAQRVYWPAVPGRSYRVFRASTREALDAPAPDLPFVDASSSPATVPVDDPSHGVYVRVFEMAGPVVTGGSPAAIAPTFDVHDYPDWPGPVTPALWDVNGDGCLDLVGAWGTCDGRFQRYALATLGLQGLGAQGRPNRDSRFGDFNGDGLVDIFTNIYGAADGGPHAAILHIGEPGGGFHEDPGIAAMQIRGFGETVVAADFDNDGDLDLFLPHYSHRNDGGHNWLLVNDGAGHFTDRAQAAGLALNVPYPPEGAQALDFDGDGWVDLYVASRLFLNNGDLTFTDAADRFHTPILFDEGLRLADVDLDGDFDLLHHDSQATRLFTNTEDRFDDGRVVAGANGGGTFGYGLNVCDVNGDGFEDLIVASNAQAGGTGRPRLLLNAGGAFVASDLGGGAAAYNDLLACADLDGSGLPDVVGRWTVPAGTSDPEDPRLVRFRSYVNTGASAGTIRVRVTDAAGALNQQGRLVRLRPSARPDRTLVRVVESGSAYMAQNGYDLVVPAPWPGTYDIEVRFGGGWVTTTASPGDALTIRADGTVVPGLH